MEPVDVPAADAAALLVGLHDAGVILMCLFAIVLGIATVRLMTT